MKERANHPPCQIVEKKELSSSSFHHSSQLDFIRRMAGSQEMKESGKRRFIAIVISEDLFFAQFICFHHIIKKMRRSKEQWPNPVVKYVIV